MLSDQTIKRDNQRYPLPRRFLLKARETFSRNKRRKLNQQLSKKLADCSFTIFSNNCLGTVFYHDSGKPYTSPLINTAMDGDDFLKFLEDPKRYINGKMKFVRYDGYNYPISQIEDIEIRFVHYKSEEEAEEKFYKRAKKINWDNIFVVATNHDGLGTEKNMDRFDKLPYKKIMYVSKDYPKYDWAVLVPQFKGRFQVRIMTGYANFKGQRYYETAFDLASYVKEQSIKRQSNSSVHVNSNILKD